MQNKLQELTDKLYQEGLSKGRQEAEELKARAKQEAEALLEQARREAESIKAQARKEADELRRKAESDIRMAANQTIAAVKQSVERLVTAKALAEPAVSALAAPDFIRELIRTIASAYRDGAEATDLSVVLPAPLQQELETFLREETGRLFGKGTEIRFSKQLSNGFRIGPKDGGYLISFTGSDFEQMLAEYLRPATRKLLFG